MTPAQARSATDRALANHSRLIIRHYTLEGIQSRPFVEGEVRGRIRKYEPQEIVGEVQQGDLKAVISATDYEGHGFPGLLRKGDRIIRGREEWQVMAADPETRRLGGTIVAYELRLRG